VNLGVRICVSQPLEISTPPASTYSTVLSRSLDTASIHLYGQIIHHRLIHLSPHSFAACRSSALTHSLVTAMASAFAPKALRLASVPRKRLFSTVVDDRLGSTILPSAGSAPAAPGSVLTNATKATTARNVWSKDEIREIYNTPLMELAFKSVSILNNTDISGNSSLSYSRRVPSTAASTILQLSSSVHS